MINIVDYKTRPKSLGQAKVYYRTINILNIAIEKLCIIANILI